jgi:hypothetical protein
VSAPTDAAVTTIAETARINEMRKRRIEVLLAQFAPSGVSAASETRKAGVVKQCITEAHGTFLYLTAAVHFTARREWDSGD